MIIELFFDYCAAKHTDPGLVVILQKFEAAYPYLKLIASNNHISDPFDAHVVEAYWVGNELLDRVDLAQFYSSLHDRFEKRLDPKTLGYILGKAPRGARAHHSFHVFDVHSRIGTLDHSLDTMESCRIGWGRIKEIGATHFVVEHQPLVLECSELKLGDLRDKRVMRQVDGTGFVTNCQAGDFVSFHWDWACDRLSPRQVQNLEKYTSYHLKLASQTL
ncbi:DUF6390 family protein [Chloroflexota bacterium]